MIEHNIFHPDEDTYYECFSCGESINNSYGSSQCAACLGED